MKPMIILSLALAFLGACQDETGNIGLQILPGVDTLSSKSTVDTTAIANSWLKKSIRVDEDAAPYSLLGSINDPVFGKTSMGFLTQLRIQDTATWTDGLISYTIDSTIYTTESFADSVVLHLFYDNFSGDTVTDQKINVYELQEAIDINSDYYSDVDYTTKNGELVGTKDFIFKSHLDTSGNTNKVVNIKLNDAFRDKLFNADKENYSNYKSFESFFNGLNIETEQSTSGGNYATILTKYVDNQGRTSYPCYMSLHYHNVVTKTDTSHYVPDPTLNVPDTTYNVSGSYLFVLNNFAARINTFKHDYSTASFAADIQSNDSIDDKEFLYVQPTSGVEARLTIPPIDEIIEDRSLIFKKAEEGEEDLLNAVLTKAEIVFTVDTVASDIDNYPLPGSLILSIDSLDKSGQNILPTDYKDKYITYWVGSLNSEFEYKFNVTGYFENLINGEIDIRNLILNTTNESSSGNRIILKGPESDVPIKFEVSYTEI